jgi:hypothetical protein
MRTIEKIERKQESSNLPFGIVWILRVAGVAGIMTGTITGFCLWGADFVWVVLGLVFCRRILRRIASCLLSLVSLIGFFYFIFTHIL